MTMRTQEPFTLENGPPSHRWTSAAAFVPDASTPTFDVTFRLPADAARLPIEKVQLKVQSLSWEAKEHTFAAADAAAWTTSLYAVLRFDGTWSYELWYQYVVFFRDGLYPDYVSPTLTAAGAQEITLDELGLRVLATPGIDFTAVPAIDVSWVFGGEPKFVSLTARSSRQDLLAGRDYAPGEPLLTNADYRVAEGSYRAALPVEAGWTSLPFPFSWRQAAFLPVGLSGTNATVTRIQLQYENHEAGKDWQIASAKRQVTLDGKTQAPVWTFLAVDPTRAMVRYSGTVVMKSGHQVQIATTEAGLTAIPVGDTAMWRSVTVNGSQVHWSTWAAVVAVLYVKAEAGREQWRGECRLTAESLPEYWGYLGTTSPSYFWRATYYPRQGDPVTVAEREANSPLLTLPSEP